MVLEAPDESFEGGEMSVAVWEGEGLEMPRAASAAVQNVGLMQHFSTVSKLSLAFPPESGSSCSTVSSKRAASAATDDTGGGVWRV